MIQSMMQRFASRVIQTKTCWLWTGTADKLGYGQLRKPTANSKKGKLVLAHRYAWEIIKGPIPKGLFVLHKCDTPRCVRPKHLFLGTQQDNLDDMQRKGRRRGYRKLTDRQVVAIKRALLRGELQTRLAKKYHVTASNICYIARGITWSNLHVV